MTEAQSSGISRRTLAAGAAWSVPTIAFATRANATATTGQGPLEFTGLACKLPGASGGEGGFQAYVFELVANNTAGPNPLNTVTVISTVTVGGFDSTPVQLKVTPNPGGCTCLGNCAGGLPQFCTPDGTLNQQILVYTSESPTGNSSNNQFVVQYQRFECSGGTCVAFDPSPVTISTTPNSTPPATPGGGSCLINNVFPLPT
jgi:hypothetical protein